MGVVTHYEYDSAVRKIKEKREERETRFSFDSLGRLFSKNCEDRVEITEYDALNRLTEKRVEITDGTLFEKETYSYDRNGNRTIVNTFVSENEAASTVTVTGRRRGYFLERWGCYPWMLGGAAPLPPLSDKIFTM